MAQESELLSQLKSLVLKLETEWEIVLDQWHSKPKGGWFKDNFVESNCLKTYYPAKIVLFHTRPIIRRLYSMYQDRTEEDELFWFRYHYFQKDADVTNLPFHRLQTLLATIFFEIHHTMKEQDSEHEIKRNLRDFTIAFVQPIWRVLYYLFALLVAPGYRVEFQHDKFVGKLFDVFDPLESWNNDVDTIAAEEAKDSSKFNIFHPVNLEMEKLIIPLRFNDSQRHMVTFEKIIMLPIAPLKTFAPEPNILLTPTQKEERIEKNEKDLREYDIFEPYANNFFLLILLYYQLIPELRKGYISSNVRFGVEIEDGDDLLPGSDEYMTWLATKEDDDDYRHYRWNQGIDLDLQIILQSFVEDIISISESNHEANILLITCLYRYCFLDILHTSVRALLRRNDGVLSSIVFGTFQGNDTWIKEEQPLYDKRIEHYSKSILNYYPSSLNNNTLQKPIEGRHQALYDTYPDDRAFESYTHERNGFTLLTHTLSLYVEFAKSIRSIYSVQDTSSLDQYTNFDKIMSKYATEEEKEEKRQAEAALTQYDRDKKREEQLIEDLRHNTFSRDSYGSVYTIPTAWLHEFDPGLFVREQLFQTYIQDTFFVIELILLYYRQQHIQPMSPDTDEVFTYFGRSSTSASFVSIVDDFTRMVHRSGGPLANKTLYNILFYSEFQKTFTIINSCDVTASDLRLPSKSDLDGSDTTSDNSNNDSDDDKSTNGSDLSDAGSYTNVDDIKKTTKTIDDDDADIGEDVDKDGQVPEWLQKTKDDNGLNSDDDDDDDNDNNEEKDQKHSETMKTLEDILKSLEDGTDDDADNSDINSDIGSVITTDDDDNDTASYSDKDEDDEAEQEWLDSHAPIIWEKEFYNQQQWFYTTNQPSNPIAPFRDNIIMTPDVKEEDDGINHKRYEFVPEFNPILLNILYPPTLYREPIRADSNTRFETHTISLSTSITHMMYHDWEPRHIVFDTAYSRFLGRLIEMKLHHTYEKNFLTFINPHLILHQSSQALESKRDYAAELDDLLRSLGFDPKTMKKDGEEDDSDDDTSNVDGTVDIDDELTTKKAIKEREDEINKLADELKEQGLELSDEENKDSDDDKDVNDDGSVHGSDVESHSRSETESEEEEEEKRHMECTPSDVNSMTDKTIRESLRIFQHVFYPIYNAEVKSEPLYRLHNRHGYYSEGDTFRVAEPLTVEDGDYWGVKLRSLRATIQCGRGVAGALSSIDGEYPVDNFGDEFPSKKSLYDDSDEEIDIDPEIRAEIEEKLDYYQAKLETIETLPEDEQATFLAEFKQFQEDTEERISVLAKQTRERKLGELVLDSRGQAYQLNSQRDGYTPFEPWHRISHYLYASDAKIKFNFQIDKIFQHQFHYIYTLINTTNIFYILDFHIQRRYYLNKMVHIKLRSVYNLLAQARHTKTPLDLIKYKTINKWKDEDGFIDLEETKLYYPEYESYDYLHFWGLMYEEVGEYNPLGTEAILLDKAIYQFQTNAISTTDDTIYTNASQYESPYVLAQGNNYLYGRRYVGSREHSEQDVVSALYQPIYYYILYNAFMLHYRLDVKANINVYQSFLDTFYRFNIARRFITRIFQLSIENDSVTYPNDTYYEVVNTTYLLDTIFRIGVQRCRNPLTTTTTEKDIVLKTYNQTIQLYTESLLAIIHGNCNSSFATPYGQNINQHIMEYYPKIDHDTGEKTVNTDAYEYRARTTSSGDSFENDDIVPIDTYPEPKLTGFYDVSEMFDKRVNMPSRWNNNQLLLTMRNLPPKPSWFDDKENIPQIHQAYGSVYTWEDLHEIVPKRFPKNGPIIDGEGNSIPIEKQCINEDEYNEKFMPLFTELHAFQTQFCIESYIELMLKSNDDEDLSTILNNINFTTTMNVPTKIIGFEQHEQEIKLEESVPLQTLTYFNDEDIGLVDLNEYTAPAITGTTFPPNSCLKYPKKHIHFPWVSDNWNIPIIGDDINGYKLDKFHGSIIQGYETTLPTAIPTQLQPRDDNSLPFQSKSLSHPLITPADEIIGLDKLIQQCQLYAADRPKIMLSE